MSRCIRVSPYKVEQMMGSQGQSTGRRNACASSLAETEHRSDGLLVVGARLGSNASLEDAVVHVAKCIRTAAFCGGLYYLV